MVPGWAILMAGTGLSRGCRLLRCLPRHQRGAAHGCPVCDAFRGISAGLHTGVRSAMPSAASGGAGAVHGAGLRCLPRHQGDEATGGAGLRCLPRHQRGWLHTGVRSAITPRHQRGARLGRADQQRPKRRGRWTPRPGQKIAPCGPCAPRRLHQQPWHEEIERRDRPGRGAHAAHWGTRDRHGRPGAARDRAGAGGRCASRKQGDADPPRQRSVREPRGGLGLDDRVGRSEGGHRGLPGLVRGPRDPSLGARPRRPTAPGDRAHRSRCRSLRGSRSARGVRRAGSRRHRRQVDPSPTAVCGGRSLRRSVRWPAQIRTCSREPRARRSGPRAGRNQASE